MAKTYTLLNKGSAPSETVTISPVERANFTEIHSVSLPTNAIAGVVYEGIAEDPEVPLVLMSTIRNATVFHPMRPDDRQAGFIHDISIHTAVRVDDSVSGESEYQPLRASIQIAHAGSAPLGDYSTHLIFQMLMSVAFEEVLGSGLMGNLTLSQLERGSVRLVSVEG